MKMKNIPQMLRITYMLAVTLAVILVTAGVRVSAKTVRAAAYASSDYDGSVTIPTDTSSRLLDMTEQWDFLGDVMNVKRYIQNGFCTAYALIDTTVADGETTFTLELSSDLSAYNVLCLGVGYTSYHSSSSPIKVQLRLTDSGGNRVTAQTYLKPTVPSDEASANENVTWSLVCFDISDFDTRSDAASLVMTLSYDKDTPPNVIRVTNPYVSVKDNGGFDYAERYLTASLKASVGVFGMKSGAVRPDERGQVRMSGDIVLPEQPRRGSTAFVELKLSSLASGGLTVGLTFENGETSYSPRVTLSPDRNGDVSVVLPFTMTEYLRGIELSFDSMTCDGYFKLERITLLTEGRTPIVGDSSVGKLTSLSQNGDSLLFSGVMERDAVREYGDATIGFYAVPCWKNSSVGDAVELGQTKVSTRFDHTVELSAYPALSDAYLFFAAVRTADDELIPLSAPSSPTAAELPERTLSNVGLYGAASVGVFESNASHVIVDVPLDMLLCDGDEDRDPLLLSYTVCSHALRRIGEDGAICRAEYPSTGTATDGTEVNVVETFTRKAELDHESLRSLDAEIEFYISAGIKVYLRLYSNSAIEGLTADTSETEHCAVLPDTVEGRYLYSALVRFLCRRYDGIAGFVLGYSVNDVREVGDLPSNTTAYARALAQLCNITYNAAHSVSEDILTVVPFSGGDDCFEPTALYVMLSEYLDELGNMPWVMMYCTTDLTELFGETILYGYDDDTDIPLSDADTVKRLSTLSADLKLDGNDAVFYYYEPVFETVAFGLENTEGYSTYSEYLAVTFARVCESVRARAVFLSLGSMGERIDHEFYSYLKKIDSAPSVERSVSEFAPLTPEEASDIVENATSRTAIWDFTDKFYPLDWIGGGGVESCLTIYSDLFTEAGYGMGRYARVLRSIITLDSAYSSPEREGSAAGIVLRNLTRTVDLDAVDALTFTFALDHPGHMIGTGQESASVVFIMGSDDCRVEFPMDSVGYGRIQVCVCDLRGYAFRDRIDYMGIMVYGDHETYLDLSSVEAYSTTLSQTELEELFVPEVVEDGRETDHGAVILVSGIVFAVSVSAAVLLIRHDVEEQRERRREDKRGVRERTRR